MRSLLSIRLIYYILIVISFFRIQYNLFFYYYFFIFQNKFDVEEEKKFEKEVDHILQIKDKKIFQNLMNINDITTEKQNVYDIILKSKIKVSDFDLSKFKEDNNEKMLGPNLKYMDHNLFEQNVDINTKEN